VPFTPYLDVSRAATSQWMDSWHFIAFFPVPKDRGGLAYAIVSESDKRAEHRSYVARSCLSLGSKT